MLRALIFGLFCGSFCLAEQMDLGPQHFHFQLNGVQNLLTTANGTLQFVQFDPSLGTLNGVLWQLSGGSQSHTLTVTGSRTAVAAVNSASVSAVSGTVAIPGVLLGPGFLDGRTGTCAGIQNCSRTVSDSGLAGDGLFSVAPAQFGLYQGLGTISASFLFTAGRTLPLGTPLFATGLSRTATVSADWAGDLSLSYLYTPAVPEPSTFSLGLVGIAGWLALRKRLG